MRRNVKLEKWENMRRRTMRKRRKMMRKRNKKNEGMIRNKMLEKDNTTEENGEKTV